MVAGESEALSIRALKIYKKNLTNY